MYSPKSEYVKLALDSIIYYLKTGEKKKVNNIKEIFKEKKSCFVTLHKSDKSLRGCIGTILPFKDNLYEEIVENTISASTKDPRFRPLTNQELEEISLSVDVLSEATLIKDISELDCKKFGIIICNDTNQGVLLPNLDGISSVEEQIRVTKLKAGIYQISNKNLKIYKFSVDRYY